MWCIELRADPDGCLPRSLKELNKDWKITYGIGICKLTLLGKLQLWNQADAGRYQYRLVKKA
jgi:hypothetical protein